MVLEMEEPIKTSRVRLNVFLASAGFGSRRSVEELIFNNKVTVNGQAIQNLATRVDPQRDKVICNGKLVVPLNLRYVMLHKPIGYACTRRDPHAAKTIYDLLPLELHSLVYAGRLDVDSEGLLLLSNDGAWINQVTHPKYQTIKTYEVEVEGQPQKSVLETACRGIYSKGQRLKIASAQFLSKSQKSTRLQITLCEGKNRELRRILGALHHPVIRLQRIAIGNLKIGDLKICQWRDLNAKEIAQALSSIRPPHAEKFCKTEINPVKLLPLRPCNGNPLNL